MDDPIRRIDPNFRLVGWQTSEEWKPNKYSVPEQGGFKAVIVTKNQDLEEDENSYVKIKK